MIFLVALLLFATEATGQEIVLRQLADGLEMPTAISQSGDSRLFIVTQHGRILVYDKGLLTQPFLDITPDVLCCGERGLLDLAFHPRFVDNGFFYITYVDIYGNLIIARYNVAVDDPNAADPQSRSVVMTIEHPWGAHYGGRLAFGPDGFLYVGLGDGSASGDPSGSAQNLESLLGKILRIDVHHAMPYEIPPANPFAGALNARGEIWAYGLRNPWRFSFDRVRGDLWIADVGEATWEEIDRQPAMSAGAENYGWPEAEGAGCFGSQSCDLSGVTEPVLQYSHQDKNCAVIGGYRYSGAASSRLHDTYIFGDFCSGRIWGALPDASGKWNARLLLKAPFKISSFGEDAKGELYVLDYGGRLLKIEDAIPYVPRRRAAGH
jgi:glucose/arabinose dehydrogenase